MFRVPSNNNNKNGRIKNINNTQTNENKNEKNIKFIWILTRLSFVEIETWKNKLTGVKNQRQLLL